MKNRSIREYGRNWKVGSDLGLNLNLKYFDSVGFLQ